MQTEWSCSGPPTASPSPAELALSGQGRAAPPQPVFTKGLCSCAFQSKNRALYGILGEMRLQKLSASSVHAWIPVIFIQRSIKLAAGEHLYPETSRLGEMFMLWRGQTYNKICLFINKITLLLLLCTHCLILQETFGLFASVYGKRTSISREREKRTANWENAFSVSTTILIALAVSLSNK